MARLKSPTGKIDVMALDIVRDRERGIPRYNEYRRQYGLKQLNWFDDFVDRRLRRNRRTSRPTNSRRHAARNVRPA